MRVQYLSNEKLKEFLEYCKKYGREHDESFLPNNEFHADENNPTYILINDNEEIVGTISLMINSKYRRAGKGRIRIFHTIIDELEAYQLLLNSILKHTYEINMFYMFIPEHKIKTGQILEESGFRILRYSFYMERNCKEYVASDFSNGFELKTFRKEKDEKIWCDIINQCFSHLQGHVDITPQDVVKIFKEEDYIENGMLILWHNENPIGTICISKDEEDGKEFAFISCVAVMPQYRGIGLGKNLIRYAIEFGKKRLLDASLSVNGENKNAANLYLKEGFKKKETMVCYEYRLQ